MNNPPNTIKLTRAVEARAPASSGVKTHAVPVYRRKLRDTNKYTRLDCRRAGSR